MTPRAPESGLVHRVDRTGLPVRIALVAGAAVFLAAAAANLGLRATIGGLQLGFPVSIWQAGIGETIIGFGLLAAAAGGRRSWAWVTEVLAAGGIAFGLLSARVQGPARDIHLLLVPLVLVGILLLVKEQLRGNGRAGEAAAETGEGIRPEPRARAGADDRPAQVVVALMAVAAVSFILASGVHAGVTLPLGPSTIRDTFPGAVVPEAVIAVVLAAAAIAVAARWASRWIAAVGATLFSLALTLFGLTITLGSGRAGDIAYHLTVLVLLAAIAITLVVPRVRRSLTDNGTEDSRARTGRSLPS